MPKKELLNLMSGLYHQRLAVEIRNALRACKSVYYGGYKVTQVKYNRSYQLSELRVIGSPTWHTIIDPHQVADGNNREICASREMK